MSSSAKSDKEQKQEPQILGVDELKTEAKWLKMEKIRWKDQEGKEVSGLLSSRAGCGECL
jgi:ADP-ribose pyrophosphatase